ncbi:MAG TPA: phosphoribosylamine--glycine ligase [Terriglobales bacterium]|nr:phosphoribosylamine--glycine ligase [Terriglobales bacterium]
MNVLVLGGGGREHALAWKLAQSPSVERVFALPGSDAIAACATCLPGDPCDAPTVLAAIAAHHLDLTVVGPEAPLAAGIADAVRARGHAVFGPSQAAAQLESSKIFAKQFMRAHAIPTADFALADDAPSARRALERFRYPLVIKADGLAAGKGVVIAANQAEAEAAVAAMLGGGLGAAGRRLVIEECLRGPELSLLALCDGEHARLLPPARDHKRLGDGDRGPNTGGMGAISCDALLPAALRDEIDRCVIQPTLAGMARAGTPFQGVLYCGLMLTPQGPRLLEYNVRFGDPEAQPILMRLGGDLALTLKAAASGRLLEATAHGHLSGAAACVVAAAAGYPGTPARGDLITGLDQNIESEPSADAMIFHAGTRRRDGHWETNGGRVLGITARAASLDAALHRCYQLLAGVQFRGMQYRHDIGSTFGEHTL